MGANTAHAVHIRTACTAMTFKKRSSSEDMRLRVYRDGAEGVHASLTASACIALMVHCFKCKSANHNCLALLVEPA